MSTTSTDAEDYAVAQAHREAKRAEQLAEFAPRLAEALEALAKQVLDTQDVGTLDVSTWGTGIEDGPAGITRLQRLVNHYAKTHPVTGYLIRGESVSHLPIAWTIVLSPRIPDPRVAALEDHLGEMHWRLFGGAGLL